MAIKVIVFDLDDTLYDMGQIRDSSRKQSVKEMIDLGLDCSVEEGVNFLSSLKNSNALERFRKFGERFYVSEEIWRAGFEKYINADFNEIECYPEVFEVLKELKGKVRLELISQGSFEQQNKKIDVSGIRGFFDEIFITGLGEKERYFSGLLKKGFSSGEILVVGDNISNEIKIGNKLGFVTVRLKKGIYANSKTRDKLESADYEIENLKDLFEIISVKKDFKVVAIGGGTGLSTLAEGLRKHFDDLTLIVTVTDSGRSSGILRRDLDVLPPGDIRNNLIALSNSEKLMCDLFQYRFENGNLEGHSFGNLFIAALTKLTGSFEKAIEETSKILKLQGKVLASTLDSVHICAELDDGNIIEEEDNIIDRNNFYVHLRPKIKRVFLKPSAQANDKALREIESANLIVLCPGSLFTSVISNLLVKGLSDSINNSCAKKVYVCNIMTQVSQTYGFKASEHVRRILEYVNLDYVLLNSSKPSEELLESYKKENAFLVENDLDEISKMGVDVIVEDLLDKNIEKKMLWEKKDLLRHDSNKVGEFLKRLV